MQLALFDLDKTLIDGDSEELWIEYLIQAAELPASVRDDVQRFGEDYVAGRMDFLAWQRFMLEPQSRIDPQRLQQLRTEFTASLLLPIVRPWMQSRIDWHHRQGHEVVVITATNRWIVEPIVAVLQADDLMATEAVTVDGRFTGEVDGTPCFQAGKIEHLQRWLAARSSVSESWAYSDSHNDLPLLEFAGTAVAVTPDETLARIAVERGWEIVTGK